MTVGAGASSLPDVDLVRPIDAHADIVATLLYPVTDWPFRQLYEMACGWRTKRRNEVIDLAARSRTRRDELLRGFRSAPFAYDIVMDIGAYRDLHRHRRCLQYRQERGIGFTATAPRNTCNQACRSGFSS